VPLLVAGIEAALKKSGVGESENRRIGSQKSEVVQPDVKHQIPKSEPPTVESKITNIDQEVKETIFIAEESQMNTAEAESLWPKVIAKVKEINGPLASMLKNCQLLGVEGGRIVLGVKFAFDKQSLENTKNTALITTIIVQLSGKRAGVAARVIKQEDAASLNPAEAIGEALKVFGGELVE
jgi:hypothetical protein